MNHVFVPTHGPTDWKPLLAKPDLHWKPGHSAMALAQCWESAAGFPPEIATALQSSGAQEIADAELLLGIPEYEVALPGGERPSQTDLMVFARSRAGLVVLAVEGKVDEEFGPTLGAKRGEKSEGVDKRLTALNQILGFSQPLNDKIRYQLLHRTASALLTAERFNASAAVMLVHSFSRHRLWFDDFVAFASLFGGVAEAGRVFRTKTAVARPLFLGWCSGGERFLRDLGSLRP